LKLKQDEKGGVLFVYVAGHGQCSGGNQEIIMNEEKPFPIEKTLRALAKTLFVVAIFDCCRENADGQGTRGREDDPEAEDEDEVAEYKESYNYIAFYGCAPTFKVPQASKLCRSVFGCFKD